MVSINLLLLCFLFVSLVGWLVLFSFGKINSLFYITFKKFCFIENCIKYIYTYTNTNNSNNKTKPQKAAFKSNHITVSFHKLFHVNWITHDSISGHSPKVQNPVSLSIMWDSGLHLCIDSLQRIFFFSFSCSQIHKYPS